MRTMLSLSKNSSSRTGETGRRSDGRSVLVVKAFHSKVGRWGLGLEWKGVALYASATYREERNGTNVDPSSLLDMNFNVGLSGPTGSTADFTHTVNLTRSSLRSALTHVF